MADRSEDPLGHERVDRHPIGQLTLLDRALLRKYSVPALPDGLPGAADKTKVQSKRDGHTLREEEPRPIVEQASMKPSENEASMVSVTGTELSPRTIVSLSIPLGHHLGLRRSVQGALGVEPAANTPEVAHARSGIC